jgi:hypothetical protein
MAESEPDFISSDCAIAARHIGQGMRKVNDETDVARKHPITLLRIAYGL